MAPSKNNRSVLLIGSLCSILCVVYQSLYRSIPSNVDLFTGLPIGKEFAQPGLYSKFDLIISSGVRGPFYLYQYLGGFLYKVNSNVDVVWECFFLCFLFLSFLAFWYLSIEITQDTFSSSLVLAFIAVAHPLRGSLHAADVPLQAFVTALAAMPFAITAIIFLLRKRYFPAMALGGLVFNLHPYVGLLTGAAVAAGIFFQSGKTLPARGAIIAGGALLGLPNAIYILTHLSSNFSGVGYDFYSQLRQYALHVFVEDYWREGYGWFFVNLAGAVWFARYIEPWKRRTIWTMFVAWFVLMGLYVFNSYVTKNTAILLMFLMRATYFIKPIIFIFVSHGIRQWRTELRSDRLARAWWSPWEISAAIFLLFFSSILPMRYAVAADVLALLAFGLMLRLVSVRSNAMHSFFWSLPFIAIGLLLCLATVQYSAASLVKVSAENIVVAVVVLCALVFLIELNQVTEPSGISPLAGGSIPAMSKIVLSIGSVFVIHNLITSISDRQFPFVPDVAAIKERIFIHRAPPETMALMKWACTGTPQGALFAMCPDDWEAFKSFRLVAERGVYITIVEVNQLSLDAAVYNQGNHRVMALGTKFPGRGEFDTRGYYELSASDLRRLRDVEHIDYMVFRKNLMQGDLAGLPAVYSDQLFKVVNLHVADLR